MRQPIESKFELRVLRSAALLAFLFSASLFAAETSDYSVEKLIVNESLEFRIKRQTQHFLSVVIKNGVPTIRAHPGLDPNGWGSTWYPQPFFPGATLRGAKISKPRVSADGVSVVVVGMVMTASGTNGTFRSTLFFSFDPTTKKVSGSGTCAMALKAPPSVAGADLNLYKIASNYLNGVPLLGGGVGDTGDTAGVAVVGDTFSYTWNPVANPSFFPQDTTRKLSVDVLAQFNNVDTAAQSPNFSPIDAAYKPSLKVVYEINGSDSPIIFGAIYDLTKKTDFFEDNIGVTPLVLKSSTRKKFVFTIGYESTTLAGDH